MAVDWIADVRKYVSDADEAVVGKIVSYCGIALRNRDSSLVSFSDKTETDRVRENFLKKKLGLTHSDADLDGAIAVVGDRMKDDPTKNRVTVYYLLAEHFGLLDLFGGAAKVTDAAAAVSGTAAAGVATFAAMPGVAKAPDQSVRGSRGPLAPDDSVYLWGAAVAAAMIGLFATGWLLSGRATGVEIEPSPTETAYAMAVAPVAAAPAALPAAVPAGAGVIGAMRDGKPMLTIYFDTGKSDVTKDLATTASAVKAYFAANPAARLAVSGFNDPTGNAAANAALSKRRAQETAKALAATGIPATSIDLVKPAAATDTGGDNTNARRVEVTVE